MKVITSPSKKWAGTVTLHDPLTMPQVRLIEDAIGIDLKQKERDGRVWTSHIDEATLPAVLACVKEWNLSGLSYPVTVENFPATPRPQSHELIRWLFDEVYKVYLGEIQVPNE